MKKIIITGGLGYIGTELCRIYSGYSWYHKIIVIDKRFLSERVNQLKQWNIEFIQGDILDKNLINKYCSDADVVHHLAGITDVPRTKDHINKINENNIKLVAEKGTQNILDTISKDCKIIMPSTHVVFEGLKKIKKNIKENYTTKPILSYGKSKDFNEKQLIKSGKKYIILRLASVYGYSNDSMRLDIMVNHFARVTAQNGILKLFADGKQIKSLVPLIDVARCFKFMEERDDIQNEIFNLSKETKSVKQVADLCRKFNTKVKVIKTNDKIPNLGFSLSNKKILKTGFKFLYGLEQSIEEMISKWSIKNFDRSLYKIINGRNKFVDERGEISNYELTEPINLIGLIKSKKNSIRANHYHPQQEQKCIFITGKIIEVYQDNLNENSLKITKVIKGGDLSIIKPNVSHSMIFVEDTTLLNLVRGEREHANYGVTHTIRKNIVDDLEKNMLIKYYKFECRSCGNTELKRIASLGYHPLANNLLKQKNYKTETYPLEVNLCEKCYNCQLSIAIDPNKLFSKYLYTSSTSKTFRKHFYSAAKQYIKDFNLDKKNSYIIDVGSNDGIALKPFLNLGYKHILGIEPATNLAKQANKDNIKTLNCFLNQKNLKLIKFKADLILASNVFAHSDNLKEMANCMLQLLKSDGVMVIEVQYFLNTIKDLTFDNIYHEHYNYWTLTSLINFFKNFEAEIFKAEKINTHGGSLRIFISKKPGKKIDKSVSRILKEETLFGIKKISTYLNFGKNIEKIRKNVLKNFSILKKKYRSVVAYGAPAKATTALNYFGIDDGIDYIIDDNPLKNGLYVPGVNIKIWNRPKNKPKCVLVLAWNFFNDIKKNNKKLTNVFVNIKKLQK
jgi:nucleoside-diphosphate-sugar epimerase/SAM-dependent methyltransferase/dTDP-4-dehydrorhamnose 3,5-epimerase-like enzyme